MRIFLVSIFTAPFRDVVGQARQKIDGILNVDYNKGFHKFKPNAIMFSEK